MSQNVFIVFTKPFNFMTEIIGFATGCLWRWVEDNNRAALLNTISRLNIDAVELTFANKDDLFKFKLTNTMIKWLKSLEYVSIHAPFGLMTKILDEERPLVLKTIERLYLLVNAKTVIMHVNQLPSPDDLKKYRFHISIEHLEKKKNISLKEFDKLIKNYPDAGICLDTSHNYSWSPSETKKMVELYGFRITEVHFSATLRGKTHRSMEVAPKAFFKSIKPLKDLNVPMIIEEDMEFESFEEVESEVFAVKQVLEK